MGLPSPSTSMVSLHFTSPSVRGLPLVLDALGDEGNVRLGQIGVVAGGGEGTGLGGIAVRGHLDAGVIQTQNANAAVLGGHLHLSVQPLEDGFQVVGIAGLGDSLGVGLDVHTPSSFRVMSSR